MSTIVYQVVKGTKYAYESIPYWDKEKHAPRSKRKYLGKVDPETGEIIAKKTRSKKTETGPAPTADSQRISSLEKSLAEKEEQIEKLQDALAEMRKRNKQLEDFIFSLKAAVNKF